MKLSRTSAVLLAVSLSVSCLARPAMQQAFLVQNSGWMEPFYSDPSSQFKPLVAAVAQAVSHPEDKVYVLAFNQSTPGNTSPRLLGETNGANDVGRQLASLAVARKGSALADTDFREAIGQTISGSFKAQPGILWLFTNNKNSPNNDLKTAERNEDFYRLLHLDPAITKTLAFPLRMPVKGTHYQAKGLMVYALAYGQAAALSLDTILQEGKLSKVLTQTPARLKPLDQDALRIQPAAVDSSHLQVSLAADRRTLLLDAKEARLTPALTLTASLQNLFYPYVIDQAVVAANLADQAGHVMPAKVEPGNVLKLQPGATQSVQIALQLPMAKLPSPWSPEALTAMGKQLVIPMTVNMTLTGQRLTLAESFTQQLNELFPGDPISDVFTPPQEVRASTVQVPLLLRIQYPLTPLLIIMAAVLSILLGMYGFFVFARRQKRYALLVNGQSRYIQLKPMARQIIYDETGQLIGEVGRKFGPPRVLQVSPGHSLTFG